MIDFFHAAEDIKSATDAADGKDHRYGARRFKMLRDILLTEPDGVEGVITSLTYVRQLYCRTIDIILTDFANNKHRMRYAADRAENLMVGFGRVDKQKFNRKSLKACRNEMES